MPCDPNLVSSAFYTISLYSLSKLQTFKLTCVILCHALLLLTCVKIDFCFEVLHLYKLPASAYFIRYKVRDGAFDLAVEVTQIYIRHPRA